MTKANTSYIYHTSMYYNYIYDDKDNRVRRDDTAK